MIQFNTRHQSEEEEEESYFVSMTDMMVGLLFIFIIMLMYFALQLRQKTDELSGAREIRDEILKDIKRDMGTQVEINLETGVVHLRGDILFDRASAELRPEGIANIDRLASAMVRVLPCHVLLSGLEAPAGCQPSKQRIDAVFVEGHTDSDIMMGGRDNLVLSADRAITTYRRLIAIKPVLSTVKNRPAGQPLMSVSGYGPFRPIASNDSEAGKAQNRRIDIRFIMATPEAPIVREIRTGLEPHK